MPDKSMIQLEIDGNLAEVDLPTLKQMVALGQVLPATRMRHPVITNGRWLPLDRTTLVFLFPRAALNTGDTSSSDIDAPLPLSHVAGALRKEQRFFQLLRVFPLVTLLLISLNVLALGLVYLLNGTVDDLPALTVFGAKSNYFMDLGQWWRLVSATFLHGGKLHILFNMYALFVLGRILEGTYGRMGFIGLYGISGLLGSLASYQFTAMPSVGASGAIFGLIGAAIVFGLKFKSELPVASQKGLVTTLLFWLGVSLFFGFTQPNVDNYAHLGGLVGGVVFAVFAPSRLSTPARWRIGRVPLVVVGLLALAFTAWGLGQAARNVLRSGYYTEISGKSLEHPLFSLRYPEAWRIEFANPGEVRVTDDMAEISVIVRPAGRRRPAEELVDLLASYEKEMRIDLCGLPCWIKQWAPSGSVVLPADPRPTTVRFTADGTVATVGAYTVHPATLELLRGTTVVFKAIFFYYFIDAGRHRLVLQFGVEHSARRHYRKHLEYLLNQFRVKRTISNAYKHAK